MRLKTMGIAVAVLLSACATVESGHSFDTSAESRLQVGVTTVDQAIAWFGQPSRITQGSDGSKVLVYVHSEGRANFLGEGSGNSEMLGLRFGPDGRLLKFATGGAPVEVH